MLLAPNNIVLYLYLFERRHDTELENLRSKLQETDTKFLRLATANETLAANLDQFKDIARFKLL